jgi:pyruvate formate lyase activating enzyme
LDYPKHLASAIFLGNCNFRCPFCHNASLVLEPGCQPIIPEEEVLSVLKKRRNILEGVCITGGEPTLQTELPLFIQKIKDLGLKIKLDTNGNNPEMLHNLIEKDLIDYIAMDIKNSKEKYSETIGIKDFNITNIEESIKLIMAGKTDYEFRTTVVKEFHNASDFISIGQWIQGANAYYLQCFQDSGDVIKNNLSSYKKEDLERFKNIVAPYVKYIDIRGIN